MSTFVLPHDERITWLLWTAKYAVERHFFKTISRERLYHYWLLCPLAEYGPLTQGELAKQLRIKQSRMTLYLDRLEAMELVTRTASKDRRYRLIELTKHGKEYVAQLNREYIKAQEELAQGLTQTEWTSLLRYLWYLTVNSSQR